MKKNVIEENIKLVFAIIISVVISSGITAFATIKAQANEIEYNTTTVADALDSMYQTMFSNNYSTTEKVVGKWIDGKPVYQKTITLSSALKFMLDGTWKDICTAPISANRLIAVSFNGSTQLSILTAVRISNGKIQGWAPSSGSNYISITNVTLQYTKSTD